MEINHYTINTRHNHMYKSNDVEKEFYFYLKGMIKDAQQEGGVDLLDDTNFYLTLESDCYVGTLSAKINNNTSVPVLITSGTANENKRMYVWKNMIKVRDVLLSNEKTLQLPPSTPFIVDLIIPIPVNPKIFTWTGDFAKCLGWILLSPESFKQ